MNTAEPSRSGYHPALETGAHELLALITLVALGFSLMATVLHQRLLRREFLVRSGSGRLLASRGTLTARGEEYAAGIRDDKTTPLFRTTYKKTGTLTENRLTQPDAWDMLQRRAKKAGISTAICNHSWRATGITNFLENGGAIEMAQYMAGHADPRTTKLYDRRRREVTRSEVERIRCERKAQSPDSRYI
jgi:Phage integrase family